VALAPTPSRAAPVVFEYSGLVPGYGAVPGSGNPGAGPWARVTLKNTVPNTVSLLVENLVPAPFGDTLTALVFNLDPAGGPLVLSATCAKGGAAYVAAFQGSSCGTLQSQETDNQGLSGGGQATRRFDLLFDLIPDGNSPRTALNGGERMTFTVTNSGAGVFSVSSFLATNPLFRNQSGTGGYYTFGKFQSVANGSGSVEVFGTRRPDGPPPRGPEDGVSVPGPLPVLGATVAFGWSRRLRRRLHGSGS
jgi:hypothetical protein